MHFDVTVCLFQDGTKMIAQGVEFDICAQGNDSHEAREKFKLALAATIAIGDWVSVPQAPFKYFQAASEVMEFVRRDPVYMNTEKGYSRPEHSATCFFVNVPYIPK